MSKKGRDFMNPLENSIYAYPQLELIDSAKLYSDKFMEMTEQAFYKGISRLCQENKILRVAKGIYCIPKKTKYGTISLGEENIISYYLGDYNGVLTGYKLYNKYGITTQISKNVEMFSNLLYENTKTISNVRIKKANIKFTDNIIANIELLELLENYDNIEDINIKMLGKTLEKLVNCYSEKSFNKINKNIKYKKSTLASLNLLLNHYKIENSIEKYLRKTSKYKTIDLGRIYEFTS